MQRARAGQQQAAGLRLWKLQILVYYDLSTLCFDVLANQSMTFHNNRFGGSLVSQTSKFANAYNQLMQAALQNLMKNRTAIVIAHRLSTVASLDRIVVLKNGEIIEDGVHSELLEKGGEYADLWARQTRLK